jgi:hypothetical protein
MLSLLSRRHNKLWKAGITRGEVDLTLFCHRFAWKVSFFGLCQGGAVISFGSARMMGAAAEGLPRMQSWVGELRSRNGLITVTVVLYGGAGLTVTCRHLLSELG